MGEHMFIMIGVVFGIFGLLWSDDWLKGFGLGAIMLGVSLFIYTNRVLVPALKESFLNNMEIHCEAGGGTYSRPTVYIVKKDMGWILRHNSFINSEKGLVFDVDVSICSVAAK